MNDGVFIQHRVPAIDDVSDDKSYKIAFNELCFVLAEFSLYCFKRDAAKRDVLEVVQLAAVGLRFRKAV